MTIRRLQEPKQLELGFGGRFSHDSEGRFGISAILLGDLEILNLEQCLVRMTLRQKDL